MELIVVDGETGLSECVPVGEEATLGAVVEAAAEALSYSAMDVALWAEGHDITAGNRLSTRAADCQGLETGCKLELRRSTQRYVEEVGAGTMKHAELPGWARERRECSVAHLERVLGGLDDLLAKNRTEPPQPPKAADAAPARPSWAQWLLGSVAWSSNP
eukprot:TRINITY_DN33281_c0_g1_i1.p1 TRINITY_DN33281_c0_g1~~TRINITY_DN33281_c0_g1_i1.p1  ORF type:complete len:160 (+),score=47.49 TRINITY_DN33281_c0_g1_i1:45-524(+)